MSIGLIHRRLDRSRLILENKLRPQVSLFLDKLASQVKLDLTGKLKKAKYKDPVDWGAIEGVGIGYIKPVLIDAFAQGANSAYEVVGLRGVYDIYNQNAVDAVNKVCSKMIRNITEETRKAINRQIAADIEEGAGYYNIMQDLRSFVGLTDLQAQKVEDFKAWLTREYPTAPVKEVNQRVDLVRGRLLEDRLSNIARTESARAQNYGFVTAMESFGVDEFEFSAYPGCCDDCQDMHGNKYSASEADEIIPVHCRCRCCLLPVIGSSAVETPLSNFPSSLEEPTMEKKFKFTTLAERLAKIAKGSASSGNYEHEGRPGEVGGSSSGGSTATKIPIGRTTIDEVKVPDTFSEHQKVAVFNWINNNSDISYADSDPEDATRMNLAQRNSLYDAINQLPDYKGDLYRGTNMTQDQINKLKEGDIMEISHISSYTTDSEIAEHFGDTLPGMEGQQVIIDAKAKTGKDITLISNQFAEYGENEVIMRKDTKLKVTSKTFKDSEINPGTKILHISVEEI